MQPPSIHSKCASLAKALILGRVVDTCLGNRVSIKSDVSNFMAYIFEVAGTPDWLCWLAWLLGRALLLAALFRHA